MVTCWDKVDVFHAGILELLYRFDHVDDSAAGSDPNVVGFGVEMFLHC